MQTEDTESFEQMMEEAMSGPKRPLLYMLQFVALPEEAFQNHPELIRELEGKRTSRPLSHARAKAHLRCISAGLLKASMLDSDQTEFDADLEAEVNLFKDLTIHPHRRNGYTAHVVTMPAPEFPPEAFFVVIVHKDDEPRVYGRVSPSTRYFTLEMSPVRLSVMCELYQDGSRRNYGEVSAPDLLAFVEAVFDRVAPAEQSSSRSSSFSI